MSHLTTNEKLKLILKLSDKFDIKPYEFGNNTSISTFAARNILNGTTKKPSHKTVEAMYNYVKMKETGSVREDEPEYAKLSRPSVEDLVAEKVVKQLFPKLSQLSEYLKELLMRDNTRRAQMEEINESLEELNQILKPSKKR